MDTEAHNPFAPPTTSTLATESFDSDGKWKLFRVGLGILLVTMSVQLLKQLLTLGFFWAYWNDPNSSTRSFVTITGLVSLMAPVAAIIACGFLTRVPVITGAKPLAWTALLLSVIVPVAFLVSRFLAMSGNMQAFAVSNLVNVAYSVVILLLLIRVSQFAQRTDLANRARLTIIFRVAITAASLSVMLLATGSGMGWVTLGFITGAAVLLCMEISVVYSLFFHVRPSAEIPKADSVFP